VDSIVFRIARRRLVAVLVVWLTLGPGIARAPAETIVIAVIINPSNAERQMARSELCDILRGDRQRWPDGGLIQVFVPPARSPEWSVVIRAVCHLSEEGFRRQVGSSRAFGRASRPPQVISSAAEMKQRIAVSERALGFVATSQLDSTVKTLSIDRKAPTDPDYPIKGQTDAPRH
jgi:hypothetical protein